MTDAVVPEDAGGIGEAVDRSVTAQEFRATLGLFATGVTVVTTAYEDILHGMTANAVASVSLDPLLVLVCVDRRAGMHDLMARSGVFAVTVLAHDQEELSRYFASPRRPAGTDQFSGVPWAPGPATTSPVLTDGLGYVDCRVTQVHDGGDHSIFLGEVLELGRLDGSEPLVWFAGSYHRLSVREESAPEALEPS